MQGRVHTYEVAKAKSASFWAADGRTGECIGGVNTETEFVGELENFGHGIHAHTIGDKGRGVFAKHRLFAQDNIAVVHEKRRHVWIGFSGWNHFEQAHVAHRIEKVGAAKVFLKIFAAALGHQVNGNPGGIGGNQ